MGLLPQRRVHRARDQGAPRLRLRALADRARLRRQAGSVARPARRADGADDAWWRRRGSRSTASTRARRSAPERVLVTGAGPIGLLAALLAVQRGFEVHVLDRVDRRAEAAARRRPRRDLPHRRGARRRAARRHRHRVHRREPGRARRDGARPRRTAIVCLTGVSSGGRTIELDAGALNRDARAGERRRLRLRQREPPPLRGGGRGARPRRPRVARAADHAARAAGPLARGARNASRTTSRSSSSSAPEPRVAARGTRLAELEALLSGV